MRAFCVATLIATPSMLLSTPDTDTAQMVILVAIFAALFTFVEYSASAPSIIEFRDAPPFNRLRFLTLTLMVIGVSFAIGSAGGQGGIAGLLHLIAAKTGGAMDFPFSPVRLLVLMLPPGASDGTVTDLRTAAGLSYLISLVAVALFIFLLWLQRWPRRTGSFNVWVNLPTFDPTAGGDVVARLNRDSQFNLILGFLLPFVIPAVGKAISLFVTPLQIENPQSVVWMVIAWAFLPASLLMRGVALNRIAYMIQRQRKRAYEQAVADGMLPV